MYESSQETSLSLSCVQLRHSTSRQKHRLQLSTFFPLVHIQFHTIHRSTPICSTSHIIFLSEECGAKNSERMQKLIVKLIAICNQYADVKIYRVMISFNLRHRKNTRKNSFLSLKSRQ
uniref:Uncharacterized protein n=1 Tax=Cacopsylla melanoneura TaxID=428564 RepID=A0A8D8TSC4_9HEMI